MSNRRVLAAALLAALFAAAPATAHAGAAYPPGSGNAITVNTTSPTIGESITVSAKTFQSASDVEVSTSIDGDSALVSSGSLGGGRGATALRLEATGTCATDSTCTVVASSSGVATATVKLMKPGATNIRFTGVGADGQPLTQTVTVKVKTAAEAAAPIGTGTGTGTETPSGLAHTGPQNLIGTVALALGMLAAGTALVLVVRRRRDTVTLA